MKFLLVLALLGASPAMAQQPLPCPPVGYAQPPGCPGYVDPQPAYEPPPVYVEPPAVYVEPPPFFFPPIVIGPGWGGGGGWGRPGWGGGGGWGRPGWGGGGGGWHGGGGGRRLLYGPSKQQHGTVKARG